MNYIKTLAASTILPMLMVAVSSCDNNLVFDSEGDCAPEQVVTKDFKPAVQFVFKKHRQALHSIGDRVADAFYQSVESVHLFVYDAESGNLVLDRTEVTSNLKSASELGIGMSTDRCYLPLDIEPGNYRMVVWGGLDENDHNNAFHLVEDGTKSAFNYAHCSVKFDDVSGRPVNSEKYQSLYHGSVANVEIKESNDRMQVVPVELTKNTNDIAVWVQHTHKTFEEGEYEVVYTDANGSMHFDNNSMTRADLLEYHPHTTSLLTTDTEYNGAQMQTGALVAHISTARLMATNQNDAKLEVRNKKDGRTVFSIPFIKYVMQLQTFTNDQQYYLDCEDTYNCSFYLSGDDGLWAPYQIIINNWVKVPDQNEEI